MSIHIKIWEFMRISRAVNFFPFFAFKTTYEKHQTVSGYEREKGCSLKSVGHLLESVQTENNEPTPNRMRLRTISAVQNSVFDKSFHVNNRPYGTKQGITLGQNNPERVSCDIKGAQMWKLVSKWPKKRIDIILHVNLVWSVRSKVIFSWV